MNLDTFLTKKDTKVIWGKGLENELVQLVQGFCNGVKAQDAIEFIHRNKIPTDRKVIYTNFVCDYRLLRSAPCRVRMTVGGDKLDYPYATALPTDSIIKAKLTVNSVISDHKKYNLYFCVIELKDFFLAMPMEGAEYIRIHKKYITKKFVQKYKLQDKIYKDDDIYCKVKRVCTV